jgi:phage terminase large subunit
VPIPDWFDWKRPDYDRVWRDRVARLKALRAEPHRLPAIHAHYRDNPVDFINDWGVTFDPRNKAEGKPTTMPFLLFPKQEDFINWLVERWKRREDGLVEKSRDMGISWCCCAFAVWMWRYHTGSVIGFGSRKEDYVDRTGDPDSLFWKIREYIKLLPHEFRPRGYDPDKHAPFMRVLNLAGESAIKGEAGDNIGRGGRATMYFKDESAFYEHPDSIDAALSQTANTQIDVSTPNGEGNPFWQKRHGGKVSVFVFDWRDDPRKGKEWYEKQRARLTPVALAQEVDRDYSASVSNAFIGSPLVTAAMMRGPGPGPNDVAPHGPLRVGLDVARFGDDRTVLSFRRGRVLVRQITWAKTDIEATSGRARQEILRYAQACREGLDQIAVDTIGVGAGAADRLRGWFGETVVDVNSSLLMGDGKNYNLRAFMWDQMKDWLETASIPNDQELRVSLTSLRYLYKGGALLMESKEDMKLRGLRSPDHADSLALTFAIPVTKRKKPAIPLDRIATYGVDPVMGM